MAGFEEGPQSAGKGEVWEKSVKAQLEKLECSPVTRFRQKIEPRGFPAAAQRSFPSTVNYHSKLLEAGLAGLREHGLDGEEANL